MSGFSTFTAFDSDVREKLLAIFNSCLTSVLLSGNSSKLLRFEWNIDKIYHSGIYTAVYIGTMFLCCRPAEACGTHIIVMFIFLQWTNKNAPERDSSRRSDVAIRM